MSAPQGDSGFRPRGRIEEPVHAVDRDAARGAHRRFRAADGFEAILAEQVLERALAIGRAREPMEWVGLLVGRVCEDARGRYALVLGMVLDRGAVAGRHDVRTTPESEAATRQLARELFPDCVTLGWIHGHIRHGARYSGVDRENQRSWRQPHAIGIVVDPWSTELLAVYRGPGSEELRPVPDLAPAPLRPVAALAPARPAAPRTERKALRPRPRRSRFLCGVLLVGAALLGVSLGRVQALAERLARVERALDAKERHPSGPAPAPPPLGAPPRTQVCIARDLAEAPVCWARPRSPSPRGDLPLQRERARPHVTGGGDGGREGRDARSSHGDAP